VKVIGALEVPGAEIVPPFSIMSAGATLFSEAGEAKMVVPGWMVSVVPDVTNTWSVRTYLYAANCGSSSANGSTNQHGGSVTLETCLKDPVRVRTQVCELMLPLTWIMSSKACA
jgi:hypothetical protein